MKDDLSMIFSHSMILCVEEDGHSAIYSRALRVFLNARAIRALAPVSLRLTGMTSFSVGRFRLQGREVLLCLVSPFQVNLLKVIMDSLMDC